MFTLARLIKLIRIVTVLSSVVIIVTQLIKELRKLKHEYKKPASEVEQGQTVYNRFQR